MLTTGLGKLVSGFIREELIVGTLLMEFRFLLGLKPTSFALEISFLDQGRKLEEFLLDLIYLGLMWMNLRNYLKLKRI